MRGHVSVANFIMIFAQNYEILVVVVTLTNAHARGVDWMIVIKCWSRKRLGSSLAVLIGGSVTFWTLHNYNTKSF
jgi:hypothetical protein